MWRLEHHRQDLRTNPCGKFESSVCDRPKSERRATVPYKANLKMRLVRLGSSASNWKVSGAVTFRRVRFLSELGRTPGFLRWAWNPKSASKWVRFGHKASAARTSSRSLCWHASCQRGMGVGKMYSSLTDRNLRCIAARHSCLKRRQTSTLERRVVLSY